MNADPEEIGEYLCALANSAALGGKARAYLVWGVDDETDAAGENGKFRPYGLNGTRNVIKYVPFWA